MVDSTTEELARLRERVEQLEKRRRSPATLVAMLALVAALSGGTAWAAATVGTSDIKNKAVTTPKLDTEAVTTAKLGPQAVKPAKIALGAVRTAKIFNAAVTTAKLADDSVTTAKIQNGQVRAPDLGLIVTRINSASLAAGATGGVVASCNAGELLISGGHDTSFSTHLVNRASYRSGNGWAVLFRNNDAVTRNIYAFAYCLAAP
jgi:hypothetical protein